MSLYELLSPRGPEPAFSGITAGIVTDITDPDKKNRVKVRLINRDDSTQETDYIRVMTPAAGNEFGFYDLPEVGDEVLVGFLDGDFTDPYVLGCLWNTKAPAPVTLADGKNDLRGLKSRTAHKLEFNDGEDAPGVTLVSAAESTLLFDDKGQAIKLADKDGANALTIDIAGGNVTLEAKTKLTLKVGGSSIEIDSSSITIKTSGNITIDGQQVSISGKSTVEAKATGQLNLEASGPANLKGAIVKIN